MGSLRRPADPVAARIAAACTLTQLACSPDARAASIHDHHIVLALARWVDLLAESEPSLDEALDALAAFVANAATCEQVLAVYSFANGHLNDRRLIHALDASMRPPLELAALLPAPVVAEALTATIADDPSPASTGATPKRMRRQLATTLDVNDPELSHLLATFAAACRLTGTTMTFGQLHQAFQDVRALFPHRPRIIVRVALEEPPAGTEMTLADAERCLRTLRHFIERPELVAQADALARAGAPGSLATLMDAAAAIVDTSGVSLVASS